MVGRRRIAAIGMLPIVRGACDVNAQGLILLRHSTEHFGGALTFRPADSGYNRGILLWLLVLLTAELLRNRNEKINMATTSDLRKGMLIRYNGAIHRAVEYQHIAPGNWRAMVRETQNFDSGKTIEDRVRAGSEIDVVTTQTHDAQYLYEDGTSYHFMDNETFDQIALLMEDFGTR